jgi:hypothetical protein
MMLVIVSLGVLLGVAPQSVDKTALNEQLWNAARAGDVARVAKALDAGADVNAGNRFSNEDGDVIVARAGRQYEELAKNPMKEVIMSTPAVSDGVLIVRTLGHVYGIDAAK